MKSSIASLLAIAALSAASVTSPEQGASRAQPRRFTSNSKKGRQIMSANKPTWNGLRNLSPEVVDWNKAVDERKAAKKAAKAAKNTPQL